MNPSPLRSIAWAFVACSLLLTGAGTHAASGGIRDQAGFFSESAKSSAALTISEIAKNQKKDLLIETYREVPAEQRQGVDLRDKAAVKRLFESWSVARARELGLSGIYVLMTREPAHLQVAIGNETQRQAFTLADRDVLVDRMLERLRAKKNDEALLAGVAFVQDTLRSHLNSGARTPAISNPRSGVNSPSQPPPTPGAEARPRGFSLLAVLLPILLLGLAAFVVFRIVRAIMGRGSYGGTPPVLGAGGGGGGFMRSMLGGLFGAAAGMWLYNQFTGHGSNAWGADAPPTPGGNEDGFSSRDTDFSSSGGDFGDSSSGGGDFGGGDSGGGGDF